MFVYSGQRVGQCHYWVALEQAGADQVEAVRANQVVLEVARDIYWDCQLGAGAYSLLGMRVPPSLAAMSQS